MSYRFSNTDKWNDSWFSGLKQLEMLLFLYMCDNCDIAGFLELNYKRLASDLNSSIDTIQGALKGLQRGLIYSSDGTCVFVRNFLKHQKNYPLNETNKAHVGILKRFSAYKEKFEIENIDDFIKGASKGLQSPIGIGNGKGIEVNTWRTDFNIYLEDCNNAYKRLHTDDEFLLTQQKYHPNLNIDLTLEKSYKDFWGTKKGWDNKKASKKTITIDWDATIKNAISNKINQVYKQNKLF